MDLGGYSYISVQNQDNRYDKQLPLARLRPCQKQRTQHLNDMAAKTANASVVIRQLLFNAIQGKKYYMILYESI